MDSLVRDLNYYLPDGWPEEPNRHFKLAHACTVWFVRLKMAHEELETVADNVESALRELPPPVGWKPASPNDPLIEAAFARCWPVEEAGRQPGQ